LGTAPLADIRSIRRLYDSEQLGRSAGDPVTRSLVELERRPSSSWISRAIRLPSLVILGDGSSGDQRIES